jgi:hypothetical protein
LAKSKIGVGIDVVEYCDITIVLIQIILCDDKIFRYYIMEFFHLAVLTIASIIFIISLATIGVIMQKGARGGAFPPFASNCPDGWDSIAGQPIKTITGSVSGTILTSTETITNGTIISGSGIPSGTTIVSSTPTGKYNLSNAPINSTMSGTLGLITPNTLDKAWYTCVAPDDVSSSMSSLDAVAWDSTGRYISYDDATASICDKRLWTARNNVLWDGVSNYNSC